jgi:preprotein translocase subunit YajC
MRPHGFFEVTAGFSFQTVPPAPGRQPAGEIQAPAPGAPPGAPGPGGGGPPQDPLGMWTIFIMVVPLLLFMFWSSRSQQKKQEKILSSLTKGDRIIVQGGLVGKFVEMNERIAKIEIAPGVKIDVLRSGILGKDTPETQAAAAEKK